MTHLYVEDPDEKVASSRILFVQDSFKELTVKRIGRQQKFDGNETKMLQKLLTIR